MQRDVPLYVMSETLADDLSEMDGAEIVEQRDNDSWHWMDVRVETDDDSELVANMAKTEGYDLVRVDFEDRTIRFNKKQD